MFLPTPTWKTEEYSNADKRFKKYGFLAIQAPRPTKGIVTLRNSAGEVSTIPFTVASASTPLFYSIKSIISLLTISRTLLMEPLGP